MPIRIETIHATHHYPFDKVMYGFFHKFPHPAQPNVLRVEVVSDQWNKETKKQEKLRLLTIRNTAPWIFRKILRADEVVFQEKSYYDPEKKVLELVSQNRTFASVVLGDETSRFSVHPDNPNWTKFEQDGGVTASKYFGPLRTPVEKFIAPSFLRVGLEAIRLLDQQLIERYGPAADLHA